MSDASTPLMRQYNGIKQQVPNALLMFRLGDFYELFFEDAVTAARELEITLTARNKEKGAAIPMCGVPFHAAEGYISRLIQKGYRVAICDQMEDPKRRQEAGEARDHAHGHARHRDGRAAWCARARTTFWRRSRAAGRAPRVAHVDVSTGEFRVTEMEPAEVAGALEQLGAREVLFPTDLPLLAGEERAGPRFVRTELEDWIFTHDYADRTLRDHFKLLSLDGCGLAEPPRGRGRGRRDSALPARNAARGARSPGPAHLLRPRRVAWCWTRSRCATWNCWSRCSPPMPAVAGAAHRARRARPDADGHGRPSAAAAPAAPVAWIARRSSSGWTRWANCAQQTILRAELRKQLGGILDLERLLAKVTLGSAGPRDVLALGRSLEKIPALKRCFDTQQAERLRNLHDRLDEVPEVARPDSAAPSPTSRR